MTETDTEREVSQRKRKTYVLKLGLLGGSPFIHYWDREC